MKFWFDEDNILELEALSQGISRVSDHAVRQVLLVGLSRLIITKKMGVSLAWDVSHSRPHRKWDIAPVRAIDAFEQSVISVLERMPFAGNSGDLPSVTFLHGDARQIPLQSDSIDKIITSPPYLNAIDYMRGHKLSLIWMNRDSSELKRIRSSMVGSEIGHANPSETVSRIYGRSIVNNKEFGRYMNIMHRYISDMHEVLGEYKRVLKTGSELVMVIGNNRIKGVEVRNSEMIKEIARDHGLQFRSESIREIPASRRYLPISSSGVRKELEKRMKTEVVLRLEK
jgi:hypothetical protein